jgi:transposase-like protein
VASNYSKRYSDEYKRDAIELVRSGRTVTDVAREIGISSESLRKWVKKARAAEAAPVAERDADGREEELKRLRKLTVEQAKTIEILKSDSFLREGERWVSAVCRFIRAEKAHYTIVLLCRVTKSARSTCYAWVSGTEAREARRRADEELAQEITVVHIASRGHLRRAPRHGRTAPPGPTGQPQTRRTGHARARDRRPHPAHRAPHPDRGARGHRWHR